MAQSFDVSLADVSPDLQSALAERERVRVIVEFDFPQIAEDAPDDFDSERRYLQLDASRDAAIERALGISADELAATPVSIDRPSISHEYSYTPAAAMYLDADEIAALRRDPSVRRVVLDRVSRPLLDTSIGLVGAADLHTAGLTGQGVSVAILDTGVDHQHPMVSGQIIESACFSTPDPAQQITSFCPNGQASDTVSAQAGDDCEDYANDPVNGANGCGHGTHVAGIAAGRDFQNPDNPAQTVRGVAPGAGIVAVQVFHRLDNAEDCGRSGPVCALSATSDQLAALEWLYANRATLNLASINMSLGGGQYRSACDQEVITPIIRQLRTAGIATAIASGNESYPDTVASPACITPAVTVGSSTDSDTLSSFSNTGYLIDLLAPGTQILSAQATANDAGAGGAVAFNGTSMATPHVAGAFALLRAAHSNASVDAIENALESTGRNIAHPRSGLQAPRIRVDLAHAELTRYGTGRVGSLEITPLRAFDSLVSTRNPVTSFGTAHTLRNTGSTPISWQARADAPWIRFSEQSISNTEITESTVPVLNGTVQPGESQRIFVFGNGTGMAPGAYQSYYEIAPQTANSRVLLGARLSIAAPPRNDDFANATTLVFPVSLLQFDTIGAATETGEPVHGPAGSGASVWFSWTANVSGNVVVQVEGRDFSPVLAAYTGQSLSALTPVVTTATQGNTALAFNAVAGTTYHFAVAGENGASGQVGMAMSAIQPPANDDAENAQAISGAQGRVSGYNVAATRDDHESAQLGGRSVWYAWTAPQSGLVFFEGSVATITPLLTAYNSSESVVADTSANAIAFQAVAGQVYYVSVNGLNGGQGVFELAWVMTETPSQLAASVLPTVRTGRVGDATTAFATLINPARSGVAGENCRIEAPPGFQGSLSYQTTDPATNTPTGQADTPVTIPAGSAQSFVFALTPSVPLSQTMLRPIFVCENIAAASPVQDLNTFRFVADGYRNTDIAAVAATIGNTGFVNVPLNGATAFSMAMQNQGVDMTDGRVLVLVNGFRVHNSDGSVVPVGPEMPVVVEMCETDPATGQCATTRSNAQPHFDLASGQTRTFTLFVRGQGQAIAAAPGQNRITVLLIDSDENIYGGTSVAVRTVADP
jgi:subtilisin family serine protease